MSIPPGSSSDALCDPLARFRSSMGASATDYPQPQVHHHHSVGRASSRATSRSPDPDSGHNSDEDGSQLLRLIDEATHATTGLGEDGHLGGTYGNLGGTASRDPGGSFVVTANASMSSFAHASTTAHQALFGSPPPPSPPTFAEATALIAAAGHAKQKTPATGPIGAASQPGSPPPFGMMSHSIHQASSSATSMHSGLHANTSSQAQTQAQQPPPPPPPGGPLETMIVRNHRGVFLLHPVGKAAVAGASHPNTPPYAPPQYANPHTTPSAGGVGASPPVSPLPSYALPPPVPPMSSSIGHSIGANTSGGPSGAAAPAHAAGAKAGHGQSPPCYPAPPPYRSPSAKGSGTAGGPPV